MFNILISFIYVFISLSLDAAIGREYFERDTIDFPNYVMNCLGSGLVCAVALVPLVYILGPWVEKITGVPVMLLWVVLAVGFCRYVTQILLIIWQSGSKALSYSALQVGQALMDTGLTLFFILVLGMGLSGRVDAIFYAALAFAVISLIYLWRGGWLKPGYNRGYLRMAYRIGIPMIPHAVGGVIIGMADRFLLMNMQGPAETGYYFVGLQIGSIIGVGVWAFNQAWVPWLFHKLKNGGEQGKRVIVQFTYAYSGLILLAAGVISLIAPWVFHHFIRDDFSPGLAIVPWIAFGGAFTGMYYMLGGYIIYTRKTHILSFLTLLSGIVNVVSSYIFISMNGYVGAAQGTILSNVVLLVLTCILVARIYSMPWLLKKPVEG